MSTLRQFVRKPQARPPSTASSAGSRLPAEHSHLLEPASRQLLCSCEPCAILFSGQQGGRYRRVPRDIESLPDFRLTDDQWEDLHLPINLAFFVQSTPAGRVLAFYPSPAGAIESLLTLEAWQALVDENPVLERARAGRRGAAGQPPGRARDITACRSTSASSWSA